MEKDEILARATQHYLISRDFNGLPIDDFGEHRESARHTLRELVRECKIVLNFGDRHPNPHILAFQPEPQDEQIAKLDRLTFEAPVYKQYGPIKVKTNQTTCCIYPTKSYLRSAVDVSLYKGRPFTLMLALGEPQLGYRTFNLRVLEFYKNDPRYSYDTDDIRGRISVRSGNNLEPADDTFLETFGFAYSKDLKSRYVAAYLRYLSGFTPEHQQRWKLEQIDTETLLHPDYARATAGHWDTQESMFNAFCEELRIVNEMTVKIWGIPLFRTVYGRNAKPVGFSFLIRPTRKEYEGFVHLLDKMISDNLNKKFFKGQIDLTTRREKNGVTTEEPKNTITLLAEWLTKKVRLSDPCHQDSMIETFKKIRRERGPIAHQVADDEWDDSYFARQRGLMMEAYGAIRTLRLIFAIHPSSMGIEVPDWLQNSEIRTF
jgi:hypothetical protein